MNSETWSANAELDLFQPDAGPRCGRCGERPATYQGADPARGKFCPACADRCHESTDFAHICEVCAAPEERYP